MLLIMLILIHMPEFVMLSGSIDTYMHTFMHYAFICCFLLEPEGLLRV